MAKITGYELSRNWFDFVWENPDLINSHHTSLYLWLCEINNRCGWSDKFQITGKECMTGMSCKSYNTYKKCLENLIEWGFVKMVKRSVNQYQCNIIALSKIDKAHGKALDKALIKHKTKQSGSTGQSTDSILKHETTKPKTIEQRKADFILLVNETFPTENKERLKSFTDYWSEYSPDAKKMRWEKQDAFDLIRRMGTWTKNESTFSTPEKKQHPSEIKIKYVATPLFKTP